MKKIIKICLLIAIFIAGGMTMDAKTTIKKTKAKTTRNSNSSFTKKYKGNIGPYDVTVTLTFYDEDYDSHVRSTNWKVKGSYIYTKAGNKLTLKGDFTSFGPSLYLTEYTPGGKCSGEWHLAADEEADDPWFGSFDGDFKNLSNGKIYEVHLKSISR